MDTQPTNAEKISKLPWSITSNAANTVFVQLTYFGSVFVLFLSALGLAKTQIGFLLSLTSFSDILALFLASTVARFGYKRVYVTFFAVRSTVTCLLLLTPWVLSSFGVRATLIFIMVVVACFSLARTVAITAAFPWIQEYVPNSVRGKYAATNSIFTGITGFVAVTGAGIVLERTTGLTGFMILIATGVMFGFVTVWAASHIPGGAPVKHSRPTGAAFKDVMGVLKDRDLIFYLFGAGCLLLASVPLTSFVPLFMQEQVGISAGNVVLIQTGILLGGLLSTYGWGWTADRYGSRPIMLYGAGLRIILPVLWILMPRNSPTSLYVALAIALLQGIADMGWVIGSTRLLYVSIVPPEKKAEYMAIYSAWVGVMGGISQLLGGQVVHFFADVSGQFLIFPLDPYTGLFVLGFVLPIVGIALLRGVRSDSRVTVEQFAGLFLRGNPIMAMTSLVGYHLAKDEEKVVHSTERLGQTKSPLTVDELLEALADPRFNVRFEAVISIARTRPDPRLTEALINILNGTELSLSVVAAWALGRIGDLRAQEALRQGLNSKYHSIRAHCARALGTLGDSQIAPLLLERLEHETDKGLQMAYASTLGKLQAREGVDKLLELLKNTKNEGARMELALSLARLVGDEGHFTRLLREVRQDAGTATSQAVNALKKKVVKEEIGDDKLVAIITDCADTLARNALDEGVVLMRRVIRLLPRQQISPTGATILCECNLRLKEHGATHQEYILLALHVMAVGWESN